MDNPNPIYYKDLITPDNSITQLISQLEDLISTYEDLRSKTQAQAAEAAKSMQGVSGATEEQRKAIHLVTEESDKLLSSYQDTNATLKALNDQYQDGNAALREFTKIQKLVDQANRSAEGSYNKLSAVYRLNKIRLNEMSEAERAGTEAGRKLEAETKAIYEQMNNLQKATGKAQLQVGQYERALGGALGVNSQLLNVLTDTSKMTDTFKGALKALATPIGAIIGAIGGVVAAFKLYRESVSSTQGTGDALAYNTAEWTARWELFKKAIATTDFSFFIRGAAEAAAAGRNLAQILDDMYERSVSTRLQRARIAPEIAVLEEIARNQSLSYAERLKAAKEYLAKMEPIYEQEKETAKRARDAQLDYLFALTTKERDLTEEEREAAKEEFARKMETYALNEDIMDQARILIKLEDERAAIDKGIVVTQGQWGVNYTQSINNAKELRSLDQQIAALRNKDVEEAAKFLRQYNLTDAKNELVEAFVKAEERLSTATTAAFNDNKRMVNLVHSLEAQQQNVLAKTNAEGDKQTAAAIARQKQLLQSQLQSIQLQIAVTRKGSDEMIALRIAALEKQREIELYNNAQLTEDLRQSEAAINAKWDAEVLRTDAEFRRERAMKDLEAAQDLAESEFSLMDKNERQKTIFRLQQEKERLAKVIELNELASEKLTEDEIQAMRNTIAAIDKEIGSTGYNNIYELLGLGVTTKQQGAIKSAVDSIKDSVSGLISTWMQAADAAVSAADKQVQAAQKVLDAQIEARNNGYANEVAVAQKELNLAKQKQDEAIKEQAKAQKAQAAIDSLEQSSSLITASANLWKSLSGIPGIGPVLALAAITTMWGSFAAAKVKAKQVTKEEYGEGTVELLQGGSHASGHDIDLGTKADGTRRRAEGGEFFAVINKRSSRRYRKTIPDVIRAFNDGTFAEKYQRANTIMATYALNGGTDVSKLERDVKAIRRQGDEARFTDGNGDVVVKYKNLTRRVKS